MIRNFKRGEYETRVTYELTFYRDRSGGYAFPCDENGKVPESLNDAAKKNLAWCLEHPEKFPYGFNEIVKHKREYRLPNKGTCSCGQEIELTNDYMGACQCPKCGQWYNTSGQELLPPDQWGWDGTPLYEDY